MRYIFLFVLILSMSCNSCSDDWPMFQHDPQHTGFASCPAPDTAFLRWVYNAEAPIAASPVVADSTVFLPAKGRMIALQADSKDVIWTQEIPVIGSTPAVSGNTLVVGTTSGFIAMDSKTGELLWEQVIWESYLNWDYDPFNEFFVSSPLIIQDKVYVGTGTNLVPLIDEIKLREPLRYIICMDINTGKILWKRNLYANISSSPASFNETLYISESSCYGLNPDDGSILWEYDHGYSMSNSPIVVDNTVVISVYDEYGGSAMLKIHEGDVCWFRKFEDRISSSPAVFQEKIAVITIEGELSVLDLESSTILWTRDLGNGHPGIDSPIEAFPCSPVIADGKIYVGTIHGLLFCLDLETGKILWQYQTEGAILASPAIVSERVYIGSTDGKLYCFGIDPEKYYEKALKYEEQGNIEKAQEFYIRARNYYQSEENAEMVKKCEERIEKGILLLEWYWWIVIILACIGVSLFYLKNLKRQKQ